MLLPDPSDDERDGYADEGGEADDGPAVSRWSRRMPSSVRGLLLGAVACVVVIALCLAALAGAVGLLVRA